MTSHLAEQFISRIIEERIHGTERLWEPFRDASIFMTGGTGFFGRWLLQAFIHAGRTYSLNMRLTVLTRDIAQTQQRLPFLEGQNIISLLQGDIVNFTWPDGPVDYILHGAATSASETYAGAGALSKFDMLLDGARRISAMAGQKKIRRLVYLSSGVAYGYSQNRHVATAEHCTDAPLTTEPESGLAHGKRAAEFILQENARQERYDIKILRCFSFAGPGLPTHLHYAFGNFIADAVAGKAITIRGDGTTVRSYMHPADLITWLAVVLGRNNIEEILFNIGSDKAIALWDLAQRINHAASTMIPPIRLHQDNATAGNPVRTHYVPDISKITQHYPDLQLSDLDTIIMDTLQYERYRQHKPENMTRPD